MNKRNQIGFVTLILLIIYIIYDQSNIKVDNTFDKDKIWVYVEMKVTLIRDTSDYFYFGQVNKELIEDIENNPKSKGLFKLSNIRYWNNDDLLQVYEDNGSPGYKLFQISDIQHLVPYKKDPILIYEIDELHESSKKLRINE